MKIDINGMLSGQDKTNTRYLYRAIKSDDYGIGGDSNVIYGMTLQFLDGDYNPIDEDLSNAGHDAVIEFPPDGLEENQIYEVIYTNISTDYETGIIDGWDLKVIKYELPRTG
jgi:hypothetical protein